MTALCAALLREGHLEKVRHIFGHSKKNHSTELAFDPSTLDTRVSDFERQDWSTSEFGNLLERDEDPERPGNLPTPRGTGLVTRGKAEADHGTDAVDRRSRTGLVVYLNSPPTC